MTLFISRQPLILASTSPRRKRFLENLGLVFDIQPAEVEEQPQAHELPEQFVLRIAAEKASTVALHSTNSWVLGADTIVVLDRKILGKPSDAHDAHQLLLKLAGREHEVLTGFCLVHIKKNYKKTRSVTTRVKFADFSEEIAAAYVASGEPLDKAGAYGIQGIGGFLVEEIHGSYTNVVGLPLAEVIGELLKCDVISPGCTENTMHSKK
jgi:septum formation protein